MASKSFVGGSDSTDHHSRLVYRPLHRPFVRLLRLFVIGVLMGLADLIPGISGGTIALITGVYFECLECIKGLSLNNFRSVSWRTILPLGLGIGAAILLGSRLIARILFDPVFASLLKSLFLGLIVGSFYFCFKSIAPSFKEVRGSCWASLFLGASLCYCISTFTSCTFAPTSFWLFFGGFLAACAMLLPGISGSYVLAILGLYPPILSALASLSSALGTGYIDKEALGVLLFVFVGVSLGLILFSHVASFLMKKIPKGTTAFLCGCMLGGIGCIIPAFIHPIWVGLMIVLGVMLSISLKMSQKKIAA